MHFTMLSQVFLYYFLVKFTCAQTNFFWLKDEFTTIDEKSNTPEEDFGNLEKDNKVKHIFRMDNVLTSNSESLEKEKNVNKLDVEEFQNEMEILDTMPWINPYKLAHEKAVVDKILVKFPKDTYFMEDKKQKRMKAVLNKVTKINDDRNNDKERSNNKQDDQIPVVNDCVYMTYNECKNNKGKYYSISYSRIEKILKNRELVCCLIKATNTEVELANTVFREHKGTNERYKRSEDVAQKQRNLLLKRKYTRLTKTKQNRNNRSKVIDEYYDDPYWNIKNVKDDKNKKMDFSSAYDSDTEHESEDYIAELPKPGLTNLYSDNTKRSQFPGWKVDKNYGVISDDYDNDDGGYQFSTIDPRIGSEKHKKLRRGKPIRLTTTTEEAIDDIESHVTSFPSYPEFNIEQGFKFLNFLKKDINKGFQVVKTTTESGSSEDDITESASTEKSETDRKRDRPKPVVSNYDAKDRQIFRRCGKPVRSIPTAMKSLDRQISDTENGSHPWLALLVPTRKLNNLLCYASLIHPRAALSAADCVHRSTPREITLIVGLWNLNERSQLKSRIVSILIHPKYEGGLSNNLAILYWKRPLKLGLNVQPVCLGEPHEGDECIFVGWGGFDQGIHSRSRWQRAAIHKCNDRLSIHGIGVPPEAFCASVEAGSTVTGFGGSLVCTVKGRLAIVGVAVSRDSALVLLPAHEWVIEAMTILQEQ